MKKEEYRSLIDDIFKALDNSFKSRRKMNFEKISLMMKDLRTLMNEYFEIEAVECAKLSILYYIKVLNLLINIDGDANRQIQYLGDLENAYRIGGRVSLEHFIMYYEWEEDEKLYETRHEILQPYVHYLNKMCWDRSFEGMIVCLPSGYGKSRLVRLYEAFRLGVESGGTFLALCSNDDLIKGQSRSVIDIIKNPRYGDVFSHLKYRKDKRDFFLKETDTEWKLKQCKMIASYYAKSTMSNVVGIRADLSIDIDDLYSDYKEALDENLNKYYLNKFLTVWRKRYVQNKKPQIIVTGTMWSSTDFLSKLIQLWESESEFIDHPKLRFTKISKDKKRVIIKVPALDYETGESTCPKLKSTEELIKEKNSMDTYLWETNFQQSPVPPEGLVFDWKKLKSYEVLPSEETIETYAVIDPSRKGIDYLSMPIFEQKGDEYYLIDILFENTSINYMHDKIVDKIIERRVKVLVIENNTDTSLKDVIDLKLKQKKYFCEIYEKYQTVNKEVRINQNKEAIREKIIFPKKGKYGANTPIGIAMQQLTTFSFNKPNKHDDMADSLALFSDQIIYENAITSKAEPVKSIFSYF